MAKYKDTAELEYKGKDGLSPTIAEITAELKKQQGTVDKTTNKIKTYEKQLTAQNAKLKQTQTQIDTLTSQQKRYNDILEKGGHTMIEMSNATDDAKRAYNLARESLHNLTKEQIKNGASADDLAAEVDKTKREYIEAQHEQESYRQSLQKATRNMKDNEERLRTLTRDQKKYTREIKDTTDKISNNSIKLTQQEKRLAALNNQVIENSTGLGKAAANASKYSAKMADMFGTVNQAAKAINKATVTLKKFTNSTVKASSATSDYNVDIRKQVSLLDKLQAKSKTVAAATDTLENVFTKFSNVLSKVSVKLGTYSKSTAKTTTATKKLQKATDKATKSNKKFSASIKKSSNALQSYQSGLFSVVGAFSGVIASVYGFLSIGSRLSTQLIKNDNINQQYATSMGDMVDEQDALYESSIKTLGVSKQEYQAASLRIEQQAEQYGLTKKQSQQYAMLGSSLSAVASVYNVTGMDMEQTTERLISAFRGEAEAAEMLGYNLSATKMDEFTKEQQEAGLAVEGTFASMDTSTQMNLRMAAAIEQTAQKTGTTIEPITDMTSATEAMGKILEEAGVNLTDAQKAGIAWKIQINEITEALRGMGVPLLTIMTFFLGIAASIIKVLAPAFDRLMEAVITVGSAFMELMSSSTLLRNVLIAVVLVIVVMNFTGFILIGLIVILVVKFIEWADSLGILQPILAIIVITVLAFTFGVQLAIAVVAIIIIKIIQWAKENDKLDGIMKMLKVTIDICKGTIEVFTTIVKAIIAQIVNWAKENDIVSRTLDILKQVGELVTKMLNVLIQATLAIIAAIQPFIDILLTLCGSALALLIGLLENVIELFMSILEAILPPLISMFEAFTDCLQNTVLPILEKFGTWVEDYIIGPLQTVIEKIQEVIGWFGNLFSTSEETADSAAANADAAKGSSESKSAEKAAKYLERYTANLIGTTGKSYSQISQPISSSSSNTVYSNNNQSISFEVKGGYRKSLAELQRDAQIMARQKGVPLR